VFLIKAGQIRGFQRWSECLSFFGEWMEVFVLFLSSTIHLRDPGVIIGREEAREIPWRIGGMEMGSCSGTTPKARHCRQIDHVARNSIGLPVGV
jgi:hypothetical protein